tara:strand:+ start:39 stop:281 length:243 start_codon:yes stop_codon:yes gene_type:complete
MDLEQLTEFFKWMTIIGVSLLMLSSLLVVILKDSICKIHGKLFGVKVEYIPPIMYGYLGMFKVLVIIFSIIPYIALLLIQ